MPTIGHLPTLLVFACLALAGRTAHGAESFDNCTSFIDTIPAVISTQGVWCLRHDLSTSMTSGHAIRVMTNNVTIDCNNFKIGGLGAGNASAATGIHAASRHNTTVRHCNIRGFQRGIYLQAGSGNLVEDSRLDGNLYRGILLTGFNSLARRNVVRNTGGRPDYSNSVAIEVAGDAVDNVVDGVHATHANAYASGIIVSGYGSVAHGNVVRGLVPAGTGIARYIYVAGTGVTVSDNQVLATPFTAEDDGYGIYAPGAKTLCLDNSVSPMSYGKYSGCDASTGNL